MDCINRRKKTAAATHHKTTIRIATTQFNNTLSIKLHMPKSNVITHTSFFFVHSTWAFSLLHSVVKAEKKFSFSIL